MTDDITAHAIALYDRYTHEARDRRAFMAELTTLAGSAAAASALLAGIAADPAAAAMIAPDDKRLKTRTVTWAVGATPAMPARQMSGYMALPAAARGKLPAIIVIHENRGLTEHIRDVARRAALAGYIALAPDFLTPGPGTPPDEDAARAAIGTLDLAQTTADGVATIGWLKGDRFTTGRVGVVGFCWGGALVDRLAVASGGRAGRRRLLLRPRPRARRGGQGPRGDAAPLCRARRSRKRHGASVGRGAEGGGQGRHDVRLSGRQPRLPQRHLGGALR